MNRHLGIGFRASLGGFLSSPDIWFGFGNPHQENKSVETVSLRRYRTPYVYRYVWNTCVETTLFVTPAIMLGLLRGCVGACIYVHVYVCVYSLWDDKEGISYSYTVVRFLRKT
jgi:hypothetical protein